MSTAIHGGAGDGPRRDIRTALGRVVGRVSSGRRTRTPAEAS